MTLLAALLFAAVEAHAMPFATPPRQIAGGIEHSDYPKTARREDMQGRVEALLTINVKGVVSSCAIRRSSGHKLLDDTTCRLVRSRYRFEPARNAEGQAVKVQAVLPVEWKLPPAY